MKKCDNIYLHISSFTSKFRKYVSHFDANILITDTDLWMILDRKYDSLLSRNLVLEQKSKNRKSIRKLLN